MRRLRRHGSLVLAGALLALFSLALASAEAGAEARDAAPQAAYAADVAIGDDAQHPPSTPPPEPAAADKEAAAGQEGGDTDALAAAYERLLVAARADSTVEDPTSPASIASAAVAHRRAQRIQSALPLLRALVAAAGDHRIASNESATAHYELGVMHLAGDGVPLSVPDAADLFHRAADEGHAEAQHALGVLYSTGFGVARDPPLAALYYHFAAEGGSVAAQLAMGYRMLHGVSSPKQCFRSLLYYRPVAERVVAEAQRVRGGGVTIEKVRLTVDNPTGTMKRGADDDVLQYYEQSAQKGSVDAQITLGHLHYHGARGLPADVDRAFAYYSRAAASGEPAALAHLGNMYAQGLGVAQDNATALDYFRRGALKDHPPSQNGLGYMHMHGHGVAKDYKKALEYFKAAAERGNAEAQFNLGAMHIGGMGVKKAYDKALHYFTLSAHQGHTLALYNLGQMHLNGLGAPRSCPVGAQFLKAVAERGPWAAQLEEAHAALQAGAVDVAVLTYATLAEGGFELAQANVAFLLERHRMHAAPGERLLGMSDGALAEGALHMYQQAAAQGNVEAEVKLGDCAYYGDGMGADLEAAVAYYRAASEARSAQATFNLAYMYAHGLGLTRDYHLAKRHYDIAAETASEAWAPVSLAMLELKGLMWWEAQSGGAYGDDPYVYLRARTQPLRVLLAPALEALAEMESDTLLILVLCVALAFVVAARQRQQLA